MLFWTFWNCCIRRSPIWDDNAIITPMKYLDRPTDQPTDPPTNQPTDRVFYWHALAHVKRHILLMPLTSSNSVPLLLVFGKNRGRKKKNFRPCKFVSTEAMVGPCWVTLPLGIARYISHIHQVICQNRGICGAKLQHSGIRKVSLEYMSRNRQKWSLTKMKPYSEAALLPEMNTVEYRQSAPVIKAVSQEILTMESFIYFQ